MTEPARTEPARGEPARGEAGRASRRLSSARRSAPPRYEAPVEGTRRRRAARRVASPIEALPDARSTQPSASPTLRTTAPNVTPWALERELPEVAVLPFDTWPSPMEPAARAGDELIELDDEPKAASALRPLAADERSGGARPGLVAPQPQVLASSSGRAMELNWDDEPSTSTPAEISSRPASQPGDPLVRRWIQRGDALLRHLAEHGAGRHEYRVDLRDGRFVWLSPAGRVSAEARARVILAYTRSTASARMGWADPVSRAASIPRLVDVPSERDDVDDESAFRLAMEIADRVKADYLHRVAAGDTWYFFALDRLTFCPARLSFAPSAPVGLVLRSLGEVRSAIESRAEPTSVLRDRLAGAGRALLEEARWAYRDTDWVARLERAARCLSVLAARLPRPSFRSVAAGLCAGDYLDREATIELLKAVGLLEDEWAAFV